MKVAFFSAKKCIKIKKIPFIYAIACTLSGILESNIGRGGVFGSRVKRDGYLLQERMRYMDIQYLNKCVQKIQVKNMINADVEVVNKSPLTMIGKGRQGAVFSFTNDICVKVFGNSEDCEREYYALSLGQKSSLFPKVYAKGSLYIAMEFVEGVDVREYLQSQPLTKELSYKLIQMLVTFKEVGFDRIDHHKRQIYLQPDGSLKVIDVARAVWRDRVYPYPHKLLTSLGEEYKEMFLSHVQELAPELYQEWQHYIRMEEISRQVYHVLINEKKETNVVKTLSKRLLTTKDEANYVILLEGLLHKVFKEEWVKTMLALGEDPESVMQLIDQYWDNRENANQHGAGGHHGKGRHREKDKQQENGRHREKDKQQEKGRHREKDKQQEKR